MYCTYSRAHLRVKTLLSDNSSHTIMSCFVFQSSHLTNYNVMLFSDFAFYFKQTYIFSVLILDFDCFSDTDFFLALQALSQVSRLGQF